MGAKSLAIKISSIEAQLVVLRGLNRFKPKAQPTQKEGLLALRGILKGEGRFSEEELEKTRIRFREEL